MNYNEYYLYCADICPLDTVTEKLPVCCYPRQEQHLGGRNMKNRRLLALLLALSMVFSNLAMGASAIEAPADSVVNASQEQEKSATEPAVSPDTTDAERWVRSIKTLRDDSAVVKSEIEESTETKPAEGDWDYAPAEAPSVSLLPAEAPECIQELRKAAESFQADETVRAFVVMKDAPLAESNTSKTLASAAAEKQLLQKQDSVIAAIERMVLGGEKLAVRYQFTYLTNSFTIETEFANLEKIASLDGVKSVFVMPVYNAVPTNETASPNTAGAAAMTGVTQVWEDLGYTGKGMKIAVIDTGLDLDHPSFAAEPETTDASLSVADIDAVLQDLNAYAKRSSITGKTLYRSAKVPYAFNYVDNSLTADHSADSQGDHGTHVSGIAAANEVAGTNVKGMAPDAQIIVMKVFGAAGGAYTDDIVAALEDAMTLGCDVVNASLGSPAGFCTTDTEIDLIYDRLASQDIVATFSAGNEGTSSYENLWGTDLNRTANPDNATIGQPGIFDNVMTIASADNAVVMSAYISVGGEKIYYNDSIEALYGETADFRTTHSGAEYEYVIIDGLGEPENFYDAEGNSLVEGKVAVVLRGELSFGEKVNNAANAGAVACVIWNNNDNDDVFSFGMNTEVDGSYPWIRSILISYSDGLKMAQAEEKVMKVAEDLGERLDPNGGQMSSFSSWGVSPDLGLEPDLTGIGGSVYSCYDGGKYGLMSGTSMSSPQVAGVTALVMQRLYELYPDAPDGTVRELAEAMLMSTADPIWADYAEAAPRQQGAGLVDAYQAVTSEVYLTVGGDKPKASLGDSTTGKYTFSFEIHNIGDEAVTYEMFGTLNTEYAAGMQLSATEVEYFMYGMDIPLDGGVSFDKNTVTVPAGGIAYVTATVALAESDKAYFQQCWENGGYVEGYVYLFATDDEGKVTSQLNLPYLGFYGDWTEAPVFDTAYWYDNSFWGVEYADGLPEGDEYYHVMWTDLAGTDWVLGMNPYSGAYLDAEGNIAYDPSHNVVSPNGDKVLDGITEMYLSLLRNAKNLTLTWSVGDEIMAQETMTYNSKTMYRSSYGQVIPWLYSWYGNGLYDFTDAEGKVLPTGTEVMLTIDATVDYGTGGENTIQIPITVDTTAPQLLGVQTMQLDDGTDVLAVIATDETALAATVLMNPSGTQMYAQVYDVQMQDLGNGMLAALFDVSDLGTEFTVAVCDYAANEAYFSVTYAADDGNLPAMDTGDLYAYRVFDDAIYSDHMYGWVSMTPPAAGEYAELNIWTDDYLEYAAITAAEYVDGKIFAVDAVYNLVVLDPGLFNRQLICNLGVNVIDMTFDDSTDTMYVLSKQGNYMYLYSMDLTTGAMTQLKSYGYYTGNAPYAIADDDNGTIYAIRYNKSGIYTLDVENGYVLTEVKTVVDDVESAVTITDSDGNKVGPNYAQSITWKDGKLYWAYFKNYYDWYLYADLITIDTTTWEHYACDYSAWAYDADNNLVNYQPYTELVGLLTLTETEYQLPAANELADLVLDQESLMMAVGESTTVTASALPWNYELGEVTWTSSDTSVATVSGGRITGVGAGTATITATAEGISKTVEVTVISIDGNVYAYNYYSGDGNYGYMIDVDLGTMNYSLTAESPVDFLAGDYNGHDGYFYGYSDGGQLWKYDQETGEAVKLGDPIGTTPADMAYDYSTGVMYTITVDYNMGISTIYMVNLSTGALQTVYEAYYEYYMTLACDGEGSLYVLTAYGDLYKFFMENNAIVDMAYVMSELGQLQYAQSMCWDHTNNVLLWAYCEYGTIVWLDPNAEEPYAIMLGDPTEAGVFEFIGMHTIPAKIPALGNIAVEDVVAQDMLMLVGTTKTANVSVYPFNATQQTLALTSSDEAVVKVNADGTLTGAAEGEATVTGKLTDGENTFEVSFKVTVLEGADDMYGMVLTDLASMGGQYWIRLYAQDPSDPDMMELTDYIIYAEEYYDGKLYAVGYDPNDWEANWQYFVMDPVNHAVESQSDLGEGYPFIYDMTYDYATSTMYAVAGPSDNDSDLFIFDMATGALIPLMQPEQFFMSLAAGPDGKLYAMENSKETIVDEWDPWAQPELGNATLYVIDPVACTVELVGDTGAKANMLGSMSYDYDTGRLYWAGLCQGTANDSGLYIVDTETGAATKLGVIGMSGAQISGLYIISENFPEEAEPVLSKVIVTPEKASLTVGATTDVSLFVVPAAAETQVVWSSSNPRVASVDANGTVTANSSGSAVITATVTCGDVTLTDTCVISVIAADAGFLTYNRTDAGWARISLADGSVTNLTEGADEVAVSAIASKDATVYGYDEEMNFFQVNPKTGERTVIGAADAEAAVAGWLTAMGYGEEDIAAEKDYYTLQIRDMAYDAANDRYLVLGAVVDVEYLSEMNAGDAIYEVNTADGSLTELYRMTDIYNVFGMTVGDDGTVYYYNTYNDYYTALDLTSGTATDIVSGQTQSLYGSYEHSHALHYDAATGLIYHLFTSNGNFYRMITVDPSTGALTLTYEYVGEVIYDEDAWAYLGDAFAGLTFVPGEVIPTGSVTLDKTELTLDAGATETLTATVEPENATDKYVMWTSSDETVATVDNKGVVTAVKHGTAVITASVGELEAKCTVTVLCVHDWTDATCTEPKTCSICGETEGEALGHSWSEGSCTEDRVCTVCGEVAEAAPGHDWTDATCTEPKTCKSCDETEGEALGHTWVDADCETPKTCSVCGETEGEALGHDYADGICSVCGEEDPKYRAPLSGLLRVAGNDRFATSFAVADQMLWEMAEEKFDSVIVAYSHNFPDALTGSYLAAVKKAPILLYHDSMADEVLAYIQENLKAEGTVYVLGGTAVISDSFDADASALGFNVKRLAGADRLGTNLAILEEAGVAADQELLVCTAFNYADSLSAACTKLPMLLVAGELTAEQKAFLEGHTGKVTIIGGEGAVSAAIQAELNADRISGENRYETSTEVAHRYFPNPNAVLMAYANDYPDGLCGGSLAAVIDAPMILVSNDFYAYADEYTENVNGGYILGGATRITDEVAREVYDLEPDAVIPEA